MTLVSDAELHDDRPTVAELDAEDFARHYPGSYVCLSCRASCRPVRRDLGIGAYEYWGQKSVHHDWRTVSDCCDAEFAEKEAIEAETASIVRSALNWYAPSRGVEEVV